MIDSNFWYYVIGWLFGALTMYGLMLPRRGIINKKTKVEDLYPDK